METSHASQPFEVRRIELPADTSERYWYRGEPGVTAFAYALSSVFPDGERFFIDAVRAFRDRIDDPVLARDVRAFIGQEAQHGQVHERYNARATELGFAVRDITDDVKAKLASLTKTMPARNRLAITCALEHFTAMMAQQVLGNPRITEGIPSPHVELWRWHAAEEAEHKAVAFDVYQAVCGSNTLRIGHYVITSITFALSTGYSTVYLMVKDGHGTDLRAYLGLAKFLFVEPGLIRAIAPQWFDYLRPDFHPNDRDDRALLERWKRSWAPKFETMRV